MCAHCPHLAGGVELSGEVMVVVNDRISAAIDRTARTCRKVLDPSSIALQEKVELRRTALLAHLVLR